MAKGIIRLHGSDTVVIALDDLPAASLPGWTAPCPARCRGAEFVLWQIRVVM